MLHPLAVGAGFAALGLAGVAVDPAMVAAGVLMAAMPAMGVYPILAGQYGQGAPAAVGHAGDDRRQPSSRSAACCWLLGLVPA